jgi:ribosomal protein L33
MAMEKKLAYHSNKRIKIPMVCKICGGKFHAHNRETCICHNCANPRYTRSKLTRNYIPKKLWFELHPKV